MGALVRKTRARRDTSGYGIYIRYVCSICVLSLLSTIIAVRMMHISRRSLIVEANKDVPVATLFESNEMSSNCNGKWIPYPNLLAASPVKYKMDVSIGSIPKRSVTVYVRLGPFRAADWLHEYLPLIAQDCNVVKEILIDWWSSDDFPDSFKHHLYRAYDKRPYDPYREGYPVEIVGHNTDKNYKLKAVRSPYKIPIKALPSNTPLTARYELDKYVTTDFVAMLDDDRGYTCSDIAKLVALGMKNPYSIVGNVARSLMHCDVEKTFRYSDPGIKLKDQNTFVKHSNFILPGHSLIPTTILKFFNQYVPQDLIDFSRDTLHCDDLFFNWAVAQGRYELGLGGPTGIIAENVKGLVKVESKERKNVVALDNAAAREKSRSSRSACIQMLYKYLPLSAPIPSIQKSVIVNLYKRESKFIS